MSMRVLVSWKTWGDEVLYLYDELGRHHEVAYWIGEERHRKTIEERSKGQTTFHVKKNATAGQGAAALVATHETPPSAELIERMLPTESIVLTMMNRKFGPLSVDERKLAYYRMLGYWHEVLTKECIDAVIFEDIPHVAYNYIIYGLAKMLGIKVIMFLKVRIGDRFVFLTDWEEGSVALRDAYRKFEGVTFAPEDLDEDIRTVYRAQTEPATKDAPLYKNYRLEVAPQERGWLADEAKAVKRNIWSADFWLKLRLYLARRIAPHYSLRLRREYESLAREPDMSVPYVYVGLHYQPERTTCPQGTVYTNQLLMLQTLSRALPEGWKIYVKEHPMQWFAKRPKGTPYDRYFGYYEDMARLPGITIVPIETSSIELVNHSRAVGAVTGTTGIEALFRGIPALVFGYPWYRLVESVFTIGSVEDARSAFAAIEAGYEVHPESLLQLFRAFQDASIRGFYELPDRLPDTHPLKLPKREAQNNIIKEIVQNLEKAKP